MPKLHYEYRKRWLEPARTKLLEYYLFRLYRPVLNMCYDHN
jgi:hypothetical protein